MESSLGKGFSRLRGGGIMTGHSRLKDGMPKSSELWDGMDMSLEGKGSANAGVSTGSCAGRLCDLQHGGGIAGRALGGEGSISGSGAGGANLRSSMTFGEGMSFPERMAGGAETRSSLTGGVTIVPGVTFGGGATSGKSKNGSF